MILVTYAYPIEVKHLQDLAKNSMHKNEIDWFRWPYDGPFIKALKDPKKNIDMVLNVGFAGALGSNIALGQVVIVDRIFADGADGYKKIEWSHQLADRFVNEKNITRASLLTSEDPVISVDHRDELRSKSTADLVDMEGLYIYMAAKKCDLPLLSFKVVTDNADNDAWLNIKSNGEKFSKALGETVKEFLDFSLNMIRS